MGPFSELTESLFQEQQHYWSEFILNSFCKIRDESYNIPSPVTQLRDPGNSGLLWVLIKHEQNILFHFLRTQDEAMR